MAKSNPILATQNTHASWKPANLRESASERTLPEDHEDRIAGKGFNSLSHYNLLHKFIPMLQTMKIQDAKAACGQRLGKARKTASLANDQSKEQKKGHSASTNRAKNSPFCHADGHLSSEECGVGTEAVSAYIHPSQNGDGFQFIEVAKVRMSRHLDMSPTTQVAQIFVEHRRSCGFLAERNMYGHTLAGLLWERQFC